jgi:hypothetical protein
MTFCDKNDHHGGAIKGSLNHLPYHKEMVKLMMGLTPVVTSGEEDK